MRIPAFGPGQSGAGGMGICAYNADTRSMGITLYSHDSGLTR